MGHRSDFHQCFPSVGHYPHSFGELRPLTLYYIMGKPCHISSRFQATTVVSLKAKLGGDVALLVTFLLL